MRLSNSAEIDISRIRVGGRHRKDLGDIDALAKSIDEIGLLHPVVVTPGYQLIAGERRLEAFTKLKRAKIPIRIVDIEAIAIGEHAENFNRKAFTPSEWVSIGAAVESIEKKKNAVAEKSGKSSDGKAGGRGRKKPSGKLPHGLSEKESRRTRTKVAKAVGAGARSYEKAKAVVEAAKAEPKKYGKLVEEMDRTGRVDGVHRKLKIAKQVEKIDAEPKPLPKGPFRVIVADPPWSYSKRAEDASHRSAIPYPSMTIDAIKDLPVMSRAHDDSILWLWTTNAHLEEAFGVARAWGFTYKTMLTWVKDKMGTGDWLRGKTEHCLFCVRGEPTITLTNQTTALLAPRRKHSQKPDEFYRIVEALCPGSKIEIFSREERPGWDVFGDEVR